MAALIMLDQKAAFDVVDHSLLLMKMRLLNFHSDTLEWFSSYLTGRRFSVRVESATSEPVEIGSQGVPQGSILGSLLFVLSQVDLPHQATQPDSVHHHQEPRVQYLDDLADMVVAT